MDAREYGFLKIDIVVIASFNDNTAWCGINCFVYAADFGRASWHRFPVGALTVLIPGQLSCYIGRIRSLLGRFGFIVLCSFLLRSAFHSDAAQVL